MLKDHAEFFKDYVLSETNKNFILKKFIERKGDKFFYNNPYLKTLKQGNLNSNYKSESNVNYTNSSNYNNNNTDDKGKNSGNDTDNATEAEGNGIDYGAISSDNTLIVNEVK